MLKMNIKGYQKQSVKPQQENFRNVTQTFGKSLLQTLILQNMVLSWKDEKSGERAYHVEGMAYGH